MCQFWGIVIGDGSSGCNAPIGFIKELSFLNSVKTHHLLCVTLWLITIQQIFTSSTRIPRKLCTSPPLASAPVPSFGKWDISGWDAVEAWRAISSPAFFHKSLPQVDSASRMRHMKQVWTQPTAGSLANLTPASLWAHEWEQMFAVVCHWDFSGLWCNIIVAIAYRNTSASGPNECSTAVFKMHNQQGTPA